MSEEYDKYMENVKTNVEKNLLFGDNDAISKLKDENTIVPLISSKDKISTIKTENDIMTECPDWLKDIDTNMIENMSELEIKEILKRFPKEQIFVLSKLLRNFEISHREKNIVGVQEFFYELQKLCVKYKIIVTQKQITLIDNFPNLKNNCLEIAICFLKTTNIEEIESFDKEKIIL